MIPVEAAAQVVCYFNASDIDYCITLYYIVLYGMFDLIISRLQKIQKILVYSIYHLDIVIIISEILKRLNWLKINFQIKYIILILVYQTYHIRFIIIV